MLDRRARLSQRCAAVLALVVGAIPAAITAGLIWVSLGRPLLFRQVRSGLGGRPFTIVKFRTMHDLRDARGELLADADRQTPLSRLIRAVRLDEIPQLLAIAGGDMNFVGPRPLPPSVLAAFGALGRARCAIRPGLTGWAQVNGNTRLSDIDKIALDLWYIDHRSAKLDAWILVLTAFTVLRGERINQRRLTEARADLHRRQARAEAADVQATGATS
ncbi:sugar transferase [Arvimicrobium flavum]|uniref:sugar transferase n=1 Tax=Arvimicrobium flavum TaxID=3393320 RepID=UPI00237A6EE6|nr:sugar transferase [Mesorhizobium shangrilense]